MVKLIDSFPSNTLPFQNQRTLIEKIDDAFFKKKKKFVICCAPTGSGKSFLSKTLGNYSNEPDVDYVSAVKDYSAFKSDVYGEPVNDLSEFHHGAFVLTITKQLQDQYNTLFDCETFKGKLNYACAVDPSFPVEIAPCTYVTGLKEDCWKRDFCPYYNARNDTLVSRFSALSYSSFLHLTSHVKRRQFIICDEASELEKELVSRFTCIINKKQFRKCNVTLPHFKKAKPREFLTDVHSLMDSAINDIQAKRSKGKKKQLSVADRTRLIFFKNKKRSVEKCLKSWAEAQFLTDTTQDEIIRFVPLDIKPFAKDIFDYGEHIVLMSATIIDPKHYAQTLGLKEDEYEYIEVDSTFDAKKSPIYVSQKYSLNHNNKSYILPHIIKQIREICNMHQHEKGVIHTHTLDIANKIKEKMGHNPRYLFRDNLQSNEEILELHGIGENTVLVSPSLTYGVDLKDDLARFQIIVKAAYPPLGDIRTKTIFENDSRWYLNQMLNTLVQSCGRGTRSEDDHCVTYILDGNISKAVLRNKTKLPQYFLNRFV